MGNGGKEHLLQQMDMIGFNGKRRDRSDRNSLAKILQPKYDRWCKPYRSNIVDEYGLKVERCECSFENACQQICSIAASQKDLTAKHRYVHVLRTYVISHSVDISMNELMRTLNEQIDELCASYPEAPCSVNSSVESRG